MKPRLRLRNGIWHCTLKGYLDKHGFGLTPKEAYTDWRIRRMYGF